MFVRLFGGIRSVSVGNLVKLRLQIVVQQTIQTAAQSVLCCSAWPNAILPNQYDADTWCLLPRRVAIFFNILIFPSNLRFIFFAVEILTKLCNMEI